MSTTPDILSPASTPDEVFALILRVSGGEPVPSRDVCAALYQGSYAMQARDRGHEIARGRHVPPTPAEIDAHQKRRGVWIVSWDRVRLLRPCDVRRVARSYRERGTPARWIPLDSFGVAVEWPKAASEGPPRCECGRVIGGDK